MPGILTLCVKFEGNINNLMIMFEDRILTMTHLTEHSLNLLLFIVFLLLVTSNTVVAQDKIIKSDNSIIEGKVLSVKEANIEIDPSGEKPFLLVPRDEVKMIIYEDNTVVDFEGSRNKESGTTIQEAPTEVKPYSTGYRFFMDVPTGKNRFIAAGFGNHPQ